MTFLVCLKDVFLFIGEIEPSLRDFHTAVCLNNRMYLFGGRGGHTLFGEEVYSNVLWYLDLETFKWVRPQVSGDIPTGRRSHSACNFF